MFLPFRWVAGNERGEKSYVAAILCCAARANLEGVASCSTTLSSSTSDQRVPLSLPPRRILRRAISSYPPVPPPAPYTPWSTPSPATRTLAPPVRLTNPSTVDSVLYVRTQTP